MIFKLCYLFTFILSITNMLSITKIGWGVVFAPSIIALFTTILIGIIIVIGKILE